MMSWNELTRSQQRTVIKLFGGGSLRGDDSVETAELIHRGLVTRNGLTGPGSKSSKQRSNRDTKPDGRKRHSQLSPSPTRQSDVQFAAANRW